MNPHLRKLGENGIRFREYGILSKFQFLVVAFVLLASLFTILSVNSLSASAESAGPLSTFAVVETSSWAGYVLNSSVAGSAMQIRGSWIVPTVNCAGVSGVQSIAVVVAIDGYSGTGASPRDGFIVESTCEHGNAFYPASYYDEGSSTFFNYTAPGDVIFMEVRYSHGNFHMTFDDVTSGLGRTFTVSDPTAPRQTAMWLVEMVASPLLNFGLANSGKVYTGLAKTDNAIFGTSSGTIGSFSTSAKVNIVQLNMVDSSNNLMARSSPLTKTGSSFSVQWLAAS